MLPTHPTTQVSVRFFSDAPWIKIKIEIDDRRSMGAAGWLKCTVTAIYNPQSTIMHNVQINTSHMRMQILIPHMACGPTPCSRSCYITKHLANLLIPVAYTFLLFLMRPIFRQSWTFENFLLYAKKMINLYLVKQTTEHRPKQNQKVN